jgi:putative spermidine/putrescine transport system permease protein
MIGLKKSRWFGVTLALAWTIAIYLVAPMFVVFPVSVTDTRYLSLPQNGISLKHYASLVNNPIWLSSVGLSLLVSSAAMIAAVVLGTLAAIGCWRIASRTSEFVRAILLFPLFIPAIIHALGFYRMWIDLNLIDTLPGLILADTITALPYVVITVSTALTNLDVRIEQAARNLGASMGQTLHWVIVPNIMPGILSGAIFAFIHSWDEIVVLLFIGSRKAYLLPRAIWDGINDAVDPAIAAIASILIFLTLLGMLVQRSLKVRAARSAAIGPARI